MKKCVGWLGWLGMLGFLWACQKGEPASPEPPALATGAEQPSPLTSVPTPWVPLRPSGAAPLFEGPAQVLPSPGSEAEVMSAFAAQVVQVLVQPGQRVTAGMPVCAVLLPEVLRAAGSYLGAGLRLHAYTQRREQLLVLKGEGLSRLSEQLEVDARLAETKASQLEALAVLQSAGLTPGEASSLAATGGRMTLRSPIAGVVVSVAAHLGQVVQPGSSLLRIVGESGQRLESRLAASLPPAARFELLLPSGQRHPLRLLSRSPQVDGRDGTRLTWLELVPPPSAAPRPADAGAYQVPELSAGLVGRVAVYADATQVGAAGTWVVPARSLRMTESGVELLRQDEHARPQPLAVKVLWSSSIDALVQSSALKPGDRVAADASLYRTGPGGEP